MNLQSQTPRKPLRLWPGVTIVALQWLLVFGVGQAFPDAELYSLPIGMLAVMAGALGGVAVIIWWLLFSRAPWSERIGAVALIAFFVWATRLGVHESIAKAGMGMLYYLSSVPFISLALVGWAVATRNLTDGVRRLTMVAALALACLPWTLVRSSGVGGSGSEFHLRWTPTPEQELLARTESEPEPLSRRPLPLPNWRRQHRPRRARVRSHQRKSLPRACGPPHQPGGLPRASAPPHQPRGLPRASASSGEPSGLAFVDRTATR